VKELESRLTQWGKRKQRMQTANKSREQSNVKLLRKGGKTQ
jgi:hypothetical protein